MTSEYNVSPARNQNTPGTGSHLIFSGLRERSNFLACFLPRVARGNEFQKFWAPAVAHSFPPNTCFGRCKRVFVMQYWEYFAFRIHQMRCSEEGHILACQNWLNKQFASSHFFHWSWAHLGSTELILNERAESWTLLEDGRQSKKELEGSRARGRDTPEETYQEDSNLKLNS